MTLTRRQLIIIAGAIVVLVLVIYGFWPDAVEVQTVTVQRDSLQVVIEDEGRTDVKERYVVSSPVPAVARRIDLRAGAYVERGDVVVRLEPPPASILDVRSRVEARSRIEAAEAALAQARQEVEAAEAEADRARQEFERTEELAGEGSATQQALEQAVAEARRTAANLDAAEAGVVSARAELLSARAALEVDPALSAARPVREVLRAPAAGRILAVHRHSQGLVDPGQPLIEVGDTRVLEIRSPVLSQDAVRIAPGDRVLVDQWGGDTVLEAVVDRIEPQGETQISSLGVEEQRVTVVSSIVSPLTQWRQLGSGYRVLARFIVWAGADVLQVPSSALFSTEDGWAVFVLEGGTVRQRRVRVGQQAGLSAQILSGLEAGETVIVHPDNDLEDGVRAEARDE